MYAPFFGLKQDPFSIAPDPHYLFMSERHREALAHLLYGLDGGGGFVLLTGDIGTGKTTVCRCFLEQVPAQCHVAYIFNPKLTVIELLQSICDEFHVSGPPQGTVKDYLDPLNAFLLKAHAAGQNCVLIIDEAQNLSADVLEQLRLLTNLETAERKLLQILLIGQPELRAMLARPELEQLAQRVIARYHLHALSAAETEQYIRHRMAVAGLATALPFDRKALVRIHRLTGGVPRRINLLCGRALLGAYAHGKTTVDRTILDKAAGEVFERAPLPRAGVAPASARHWRLAAVGFAATAAALVVAGLVMRGASPVIQPASVQAPGRDVMATVWPSHATAAGARDALGPPAGLDAAALRNILPALASSQDEAWRQLAPWWKLAVTGADPCVAASRQQVHCFQRSTSLALLRQLDRPGILTLYGQGEQPAYVLLTGLTADRATLSLGNRVESVSLAALAEFWRGDFATYWRAPPGYVPPIKPGSTGPGVDWLATQLTPLSSGAASVAAKEPQRFDASLKSRMQAFQLAQGLVPDGSPGPLTFMQLNRVAGVDEPRLQTSR